MMAQNSPTWYDILGVARDASPDEVKAAWREATDKFEPGSGTSQFRLFNEAADVLLDPDRRAAYDAELASEVEPATDPEPTDVEAAPQTEQAPEPEQAPDAEKASRPGPLAVLGRFNDYAIAALAVLAVASVALVVVLGMRIQDRVAVADAEPEATATAERALTAVLSYDYRQMEADRDRAVRFLTPAYKKDYLKTFEELLSTGPEGSPGPAVKTKAVVTADVLDIGVADSERDLVRVVAFVDQSSVKGDADPVRFQNRVVATMVLRGDDWLVDKIESY
jgi:Mce-associated membrane protein